MTENAAQVSWIYTPPTESALPLPVSTKNQDLPFQSLSWKNFERLCYRLVRCEEGVVECRLYGLAGAEQDGIDIYARILNSQKYKVYQCKNESDFSPAKIKKAVEKFASGEWMAKAEVFVLCTRESLKKADRVQEIERHAQDLSRHGITLLTWDSDELASKLKQHPELVDDFFGRHWVKAFCGDKVADNLGERLDGPQLAELRSKLSGLYHSIFECHDRGIPLPGEVSLSDRYIVPDIIEDFHSCDQGRQKDETVGRKQYPNPDQIPGSKEPPNRADSGVSKQYSQKIPIQDWITRSKVSLLLGEPGAGKSSFLRFLAVDLLSPAPKMANVSDKWADHIPVWIPFALWTKQIAMGVPSGASVREIVIATLKSWDAEKLVTLVEKALKDQRLLLLIDGLDEYSNDEAAKVAINHLEVFIRSNNVSAIATTRPHGFEKMGAILSAWQKSKISDFSINQQRELSRIWFSVNLQKLTPTLSEVERKKEIDKLTEAFFSELNRSKDLKELACNPLLLSLLIYFHFSNISLPISRFEAYALLTRHLIADHPVRRRVAAQAPQAKTPLSNVSLEVVLARVAYFIHATHTEGTASTFETKSNLEQFLMDGQSGLGCDRFNAANLASEILIHAEDSVGIIVNKSQNEIGFYHRTIQEYLTAFYISRLPLKEQIEIVSSHATSPLWREVILGLFQITRRPEDIESFVQSINALPLKHVERQYISEFLAEIAFGNFNCSPLLSKKLAQASILQVESETWMPQRKRILRHIMTGIASPILGDMVKRKIKAWYLDRFGRNRSYLFETLAEWELNDNIIDTLFKGLRDEEYRIKLAAAKVLSKFSDKLPDVAGQLVFIADHSDDSYLVAASIQALIMGWGKHADLPRLVSRAANSLVDTLKLVGIKGRVSLNIHTEEDLNKLLELARPFSSVDYHAKDEISRVLLSGWPQNIKVRDACLQAAERRYYPGNNISPDIAVNVLLEGYPGDDKVLTYCVKELETQEYPFGSHNHEAFPSLVKNFKDCDVLVAALDKWVKRVKHIDTVASYAALVGRTAVFKEVMIKELKTASFPHWFAQALLDGWGILDPEVAEVFRGIIDNDLPRASSIAHLIPRIITDKIACRKFLLSLLQNPQCRRPDFVMEGLIRLESSGPHKDIVDAALALLQDQANGRFVDGVKSRLIENYSFDERVKLVAEKELTAVDGTYGAVAGALKNAPDGREVTINALTPLPRDLRRLITEHLAELYGEDDFVVELLSQYDLEADPEAKVSSSIGYHNRLVRLNRDVTQNLQTLSDTIACVGPNYNERRCAAFCGLSILGHLGKMKESDQILGGKTQITGISSLESLKVNIPHIQFILSRWKELKSYFGEEFYPRLFEYHSGFYLYNALATFADEYPAPRQEVLDFLTALPVKVGQAESLGFLSRVVPQSELLLEYCLNTLGLNTKQSEPLDPNQRVSHNDTVFAGEIISTQFSGRSDVLERIHAASTNGRLNEAAYVLSEGWPKSEQLLVCYRRLKESRSGWWISNVIRYHMHFGGSITASKVILRHIRKRASSPDNFYQAAMIPPIIRRIQRDERLARIVVQRLLTTKNSSEKVSLAKIILRSKGLTPELRTWAEKECEKQFSGEGVEAGFDITTEGVISVPHAIYEIMSWN